MVFPHELEDLKKELLDKIYELEKRLAKIETKCPYCNGSKDHPTK